jgi:DNA ligase-1
MADALWKPMLAAKPDPEDLDELLAKLNYPVLGSIKLDGFRFSVQNGVLYTRSLKPIRNKQMQALWGRPQYNGLDGEITVGDTAAEDCFNRTSSVVTSANRPMDNAMAWVFDKFGVERFGDRQRLAAAQLAEVESKAVGMILLPQLLLKSAVELTAFETRSTGAGHEGVMLRDPDGAYKQGRSTLKEGGLIAVKRFVDAEAVILDTYEQEENTNEQKVNELGKMKRSTHKAGKVGKGTLGGFTVCFLQAAQCSFNLGSVSKEAQFNIGTGVGLTDAKRSELWKRRKTLPGKIVKFRYQKVGTIEKPRIPIFLGFRDKGDM